MKKATWLAPYSFEPSEHVAQLCAIIDCIERETSVDNSILYRILAKHPKGGRAFFSKSELLLGARHLADQGLWHGDYPSFVEKIQVKPIRTQSGVTPVTVLTQPHPCPGRCIFCPNDPNMPKSYLSKEPGAQRAERHRFDPYEQTHARLKAIDQMGHSTQKVELIILGGTWSSYPRRYQLWFVKRCFDALNEFEPRITPGAEQRGGSAVPVASVRADELGWRARDASELMLELQEAHRINERAHCRSVGLTVETRPDHVTQQEVVRIRALGATRVQVGYQSLSDRVLELNVRGHQVSHSRESTALLRRAGFKIQAHWMANLYGSSPEQDIEDFERLFSDPGLRPDELKMYPCMLVKDTALEAQYRAGLWRAYTKDELVHVLVECLRRVPPYCRVNRVVRDIPGQDLVTGERVNGLRGTVEAELVKRGYRSRDVRAREIRRRRVDPGALRLEALSYETDVADETFLQFVTGDEILVGFLRLSLPRQASYIAELAGSALIREVHVYGSAVPIGTRDARRSQHSGLGRRLVERARVLAAQAGFQKLAVIAAVGTRDYYRALGFGDGSLYQFLQFGALSHGGGP
jgi:elongator complex protein 3